MLPRLIIARTVLLQALLNGGKFEEAEQVYTVNLAAKTRKFGRDHVATLMVAMNLGTAMKEKGDFARAEAIFTENYEAKVRVLGTRCVRIVTLSWLVA